MARNPTSAENSCTYLLMGAPAVESGHRPLFCAVGFCAIEDLILKNELWTAEIDPMRTLFVLVSTALSIWFWGFTAPGHRLLNAAGFATACSSSYCSTN
jgi:hypothetical protein